MSGDGGSDLGLSDAIKCQLEQYISPVFMLIKITGHSMV